MKMENSICRLCLHKNGHEVMKNIFELSSLSLATDISISDLLYWSFGIEVYADDSFTKLVCNKCVNLINRILRVRNFFRTNQILLKEKQCPDNYAVELGWNSTREVGTNVDLERPGYVNINVNILGKIKPVSIPLIKLEESSEVNLEYENIEKVLYRKRKIAPNEEVPQIITLDMLDKSEPINLLSKKLKLDDYLIKSDNLLEIDDNCKLKMVKVDPRIFENFSQPVIDICRIESCCASYGYKKMDDFLYKDFKMPGALCRTCTPVNKQKNCFKKYDRKGTTVKDDIYISVPQYIFEQFSRPYVNVEKLENSYRFSTEYRKISDYSYTKINPVSPKSSTNIKICTNKRQRFEDYYYRMKTSAIQELITGQSQENCTRKRSPVKQKQELKNSSAKQKQELLLDINNVCPVCVCKYCSEIFNNKLALNSHVRLRHSQIKRKRKWKRNYSWAILKKPPKKSTTIVDVDLNNECGEYTTSLNTVNKETGKKPGSTKNGSFVLNRVRKLAGLINHPSELSDSNHSTENEFPSSKSNNTSENIQSKQFNKIYNLTLSNKNWGIPKKRRPKSIHMNNLSNCISELRKSIDKNLHYKKQWIESANCDFNDTIPEVVSDHTYSFRNTKQMYKLNKNSTKYIQNHIGKIKRIRNDIEILKNLQIDLKRTIQSQEMEHYCKNISEKIKCTEINE